MDIKKKESHLKKDRTFELAAYQWLGFVWDTEKSKGEQNRLFEERDTQSRATVDQAQIKKDQPEAAPSLLG